MGRGRQGRGCCVLCTGASVASGTQARPCSHGARGHAPAQHCHEGIRLGSGLVCFSVRGRSLGRGGCAGVSRRDGRERQFEGSALREMGAGDSHTEDLEECCRRHWEAGVCSG